jgi:flavodoxin/ferredoxin
MYKAVIFYFSGTGNTWHVADKIKKQLDANNINADTVSIEKVDPKKANWWIKTADLIIFGWPVHFCGLPDAMKEFIDNLKPIEKGKHIHTFCTYMFFPGDGAWNYHKSFEKKGLITDSTQNFRMPSNISTTGGIFGTPRDEKKVLKIIEKCDRGAEDYVRRLLIGMAKVHGKYVMPIGALVRTFYQIRREKYMSIVGLNKDRCSKCGECALICPAENIKMNAGSLKSDACWGGNEYPEFAGKCALCFRCCAICAENAITISGRTRKIKTGKPYPFYDKRFKMSILKNLN